MQISFWKKGKMHHKTRSEWKLSSLSRILHSFLQKKLRYRVTHCQVYILRSLLLFHNMNLFFRLCYKFVKEFRLLLHSWKFCPLSKQQCLEHKVCYVWYYKVLQNFDKIFYVWKITIDPNRIALADKNLASSMYWAYFCCLHLTRTIGTCFILLFKRY